MKKITIDWAPNTQLNELLLSALLIFNPFIWKRTEHVKRLETEFSGYIGQQCLAFDSARSSLYALFQAYGVGKGDEIALQAFTCVALPNPILWVGAKPVYVDVDLSNFNIDIDDLEKKLTDRTKAVIIQYTFGIAPDVARIKRICEERNILLIEDCCHNLGQKILIDGKEMMAGTIGDAAIFSLGMEKVISATRGGFATTKDPRIMSELKKIQADLRPPRSRDVLRGLLNPITYKIRENMGWLGEMIYDLAVKLKLHDLGLPTHELSGKKAPWLPYRLPNTHALIALSQLKKLDNFNSHREEIAEAYFEKLESYNKLGADLPESIDRILTLNKQKISLIGRPVWLRFPVVLENSNEALSKAKDENIYLGNWYRKVIHCKGVDLDCLGYESGSCPKAEWLSTRTVNLPTHQGISVADADRVVDTLENLL